MTDWKTPEYKSGAKPRFVIFFELPSNGERWNWPIDGEDTIAAFTEILDRASIPWGLTEGML